MVLLEFLGTPENQVWMEPMRQLMKLMFDSKLVFLVILAPLVQLALLVLREILVYLVSPDKMENHVEFASQDQKELVVFLAEMAKMVKPVCLDEQVVLVPSVSLVQ